MPADELFFYFTMLLRESKGGHGTKFLHFNV